MNPHPIIPSPRMPLLLLRGKRQKTKFKKPINSKIKIQTGPKMENQNRRRQGGQSWGEGMMGCGFMFFKFRPAEI
jgi:hypothetical protein